MASGLVFTVLLSIATLGQAGYSSGGYGNTFSSHGHGFSGFGGKEHVHIRIHIPEIVHNTHSTNEVLVGHGGGGHGHGHGHGYSGSSSSSFPAELIGNIIGNSAVHSGGHYAPSHGGYSHGSSLSPGKTERKFQIIF
ncbi:keratin, type I cytoskeletal 10-like [Sitodiplosis mosellana]|uniref:keratin, type I cytoskeletal 10-like n=1 Tax=Sitodiplosis mosellana TaxID=263140 RepID=UPI002444E506|nr:keratin, type I cytoskeletal 10-like [Sitodiplosis mosellana]